jgi:hypothetical protein
MTSIAIIDGDVLCYNSCTSRDLPKGHSGVVALDENGDKIPLVYTPEEDAEYLEKVWNNFEYALEALKERTFCTDFLMAVKGPSNFRYDLYPDYKLNRKKGTRYLANFVPAIRELALHQGYAIAAPNCEADDMLRIWANEARQAGVEHVICSIDKDLLCIPGRHYMMHKKEFIEVSEIDAARHFYQQLLKGDPTDNIPGLPGVGDVKAKKALAGAETVEEFQEVVVSMYIDMYQDSWKDYLLSNGKMVHILNHLSDSFTINEWSIVKELQ